MHTADPVAQHLQRFDRFAGAVQDHVGRIEIDEQIIAGNVVDKMDQRLGRFLTGFQVQVLGIRSTEITEQLSDLDDLLVIVALTIVWYKAEVQCDDITF